MGYFQELYSTLQQATNPFSLLFELFRAGLWIVFYPVFIFMAREGWLQWMQGIYRSKQQFVLMAVDVPRENEQSMKAVEQIVSTLHGVYFQPNFKEKWWDGVLKDKFSFEIVSIDGYIQYFVYCASYNVDLLKGAIYAQYPDAEIIEVEDYTANVPQEYPNDTHDLFGSEFTLRKNSAYPIKTYEQFEHPLTGVYADPMAAILEQLSRLRKGEQVWLQFMVTPDGDQVRQDGLKLVNELIGKSTGSDPTRLDKLFHAPIKGLEMIHESVFATGLEYSSVTGDEEGNDGNFLNMTTGEKLIVEEVQKKISKLLFRWKFRFIYIAPKEMFEPFRVAGGVYGSIEQFNTLDLNAIGWGGYTVTVGPVYYLVEWRRNWRKRLLMANYASRSDWAGEGFSWLSTTEVASLFHFPTEIVKAPLVSKASARTSEPPSALPLEGIETVGAAGESVPPAGDLPPGIQTIDAGAPEPGTGVPVDTVPPVAPVPNIPKAPPPPPAAGQVPNSQLPPSLSQERPSAPTPPPAPVAPPPVPPAPPSTPTPAPAPVLAQQPQQPQQPPLPPQRPANPDDPQRDYPLHSMPGLPPGVQPVAKPTVDISPPTAPPAPMPAARPQQAAPAAAPHAPQSQQGPQPPQQSNDQQSGPGSAPPPNLPIG